MVITVYEDNILKKTAIFKWIKHFNEGREDFKDDARSGCPPTSRNKRADQKLKSC